jgi:Na+/proline symporter
MTGIFTGSALPALVGTFFSSRQGALAATASIWAGFFAAVITWVRHLSSHSASSER